MEAGGWPPWGVCGRKGLSLSGVGNLVKTVLPGSYTVTLHFAWSSPIRLLPLCIAAETRLKNQLPCRKNGPRRGLQPDYPNAGIYFSRKIPRVPDLQVRCFHLSQPTIETAPENVTRLPYPPARCSRREGSHPPAFQGCASVRETLSLCRSIRKKS